jgi:histone H3/H4
MEDTEKKVLVVTSRIKEMNKAATYATSGDFIDALSAEVERLVLKAQRCATANGRKTLKAQDL